MQIVCFFLCKGSSKCGFFHLAVLFRLYHVLFVCIMYFFLSEQIKMMMMMISGSHKNVWYVERFKSHHVDRHTHTHTDTHKRALLKTYHVATLSLRGWQTSFPLDHPRCSLQRGLFYKKTAHHTWETWRLQCWSYCAWSFSTTWLWRRPLARSVRSWSLPWARSWWGVARCCPSSSTWLDHVTWRHHRPAKCTPSSLCIPSSWCSCYCCLLLMMTLTL